MIRIILVNLLFLLLPLIIYFAYVLLRQSVGAQDGIITNAPIFWLLAAGVGLMLIAIVTLGRWEGGGTWENLCSAAIQRRRCHSRPLRIIRGEGSFR